MTESLYELEKNLAARRRRSTAAFPSDAEDLSSRAAQQTLYVALAAAARENLVALESVVWVMVAKPTF
jgi:hypothetical protein